MSMHTPRNLSCLIECCLEAIDWLQPSAANQKTISAKDEEVQGYLEKWQTCTEKLFEQEFPGHTNEQLKDVLCNYMNSGTRPNEAGKEAQIALTMYGYYSTLLDLVRNRGRQEHNLTNLINYPSRLALYAQMADAYDILNACMSLDNQIISELVSNVRTKISTGSFSFEKIALLRTLVYLQAQKDADSSQEIVVEMISPNQLPIDKEGVWIRWAIKSSGNVPPDTCTVKLKESSASLCWFILDTVKTISTTCKIRNGRAEVQLCSRSDGLKSGLSVELELTIGKGQAQIFAIHTRETSYSPNQKAMKYRIAQKICAKVAEELVNGSKEKDEGVTTLVLVPSSSEMTLFSESISRHHKARRDASALEKSTEIASICDRLSAMKAATSDESQSAQDSETLGNLESRRATLLEEISRLHDQSTIKIVTLEGDNSTVDGEITILVILVTAGSNRISEHAGKWLSFKKDKNIPHLVFVASGHANGINFDYIAELGVGQNDIIEANNLYLSEEELLDTSFEGVAFDILAREMIIERLSFYKTAKFRDIFLRKLEEKLTRPYVDVDLYQMVWNDLESAGDPQAAWQERFKELTSKERQVLKTLWRASVSENSERQPVQIGEVLDAWYNMSSGREPSNISDDRSTIESGLQTLHKSGLCEMKAGVFYMPSKLLSSEHIQSIKKIPDYAPGM